MLVSIRRNTQCCFLCSSCFLFVCLAMGETANLNPNNKIQTNTWNDTNKQRNNKTKNTKTNTHHNKNSKQNKTTNGDTYILNKTKNEWKHEANIIQSRTQPTTTHKQTSDQTMRIRVRSEMLVSIRGETAVLFFPSWFMCLFV